MGRGDAINILPCLPLRAEAAFRAFPTDERLRQKAKLKAGHVPKARKQDVEDHHDDCGTDLSGLAPYLLVDVPPGR